LRSRFSTGGMRRVALIATLAAGLGLVGTSVHGITSMDTKLKLADQRMQQPQPGFVSDRHDCHRSREHRGPEV
jgi:hypothetical protein